jgi:hypothetical protein
VALWREWHPDAVEQLQLPLEISAAVPAVAGWQILSGFLVRIVAEHLLQDESDGDGKDSRVFFRDPAQLRFDWETADGRQEGHVSDNALAVAIPVPRPDWRSVASLAVHAVSSAHSKRAYEKALQDFVAWYSAEARPPFSRAIVQQYRSVLESASLARPPSICGCRRSASWPEKRPKTGCSIAAWPRESCP